MRGVSRRYVRLALIGVAALGGVAYGFAPAGQAAPIISLNDVSAAIAAPNSANVPFTATGTITNTGSAPQLFGSTLRISAVGGSVTATPAGSGCTVSGGVATCAGGNLASGASKSFNVTVTPAANAIAVTTTATAASGLPELNVLPDSANNSASKLTGVVYSVGGVSLSSYPPVVRNGDDTLLTAAVSNSGAPQTVTLTVNTGGTYDPQLALPAGCSAGAGGATVTCVNAYGINETKSFDIAVTTPTSGDSMASSATASGATGGSASAGTTTGLFADATAFVPAGDSLDNTGTVSNTTFSVPVGSAPGLFLDLNEATLPEGTMCGAEECEPLAAEALFPNDGKYSGNDRLHPFIWDITYNVHQSCQGVGNEQQCLRDHLFYILSNQTVPVNMPQCENYGSAAPTLRTVDEVCVNKVTKNGGQSVTYQVVLLKDIQIPLISGLNAGK